jgi:hypothetical protein
MVSEGYAACKVIHHPEQVCEVYSVTDALKQVTQEVAAEARGHHVEHLADILTLRPLTTRPRNMSGTIIHLLTSTTEKETRSHTTSSSSS